MANLGQSFKTGQTSPVNGVYVFDKYTDGTTTPQPTTEERVIQLSTGEVFPPIKSCNKGAHWTLQRIK